eukprot:394088_1
MSAFILLITLHIQVILCTEYKNGDVSSPFTFYLDDHILSHDGLVQLSMQNNGNLAMSDGVWATDTDPNGDHVKLQEDGTLVVFDATGGILWQSNSITGTAPFRLIITDDVETYILDSLDEVVWSTNPSFASFEAIWTEPFNSNGMGWSGGDLIFSSTSPHCPNYPDVCLKLPWQNLLGDSRSWAELYNTDISTCTALQLQLDITGRGSDACEIWWSFDAPSYNDWTMYQKVYRSGVFKDIIIDIPLPNSYTLIAIDLSIKGNSRSDECYFDNVILRGIFPKSPTKTTLSPSSFPTQTLSTTSTTSSTVAPTNVPSKSPEQQPTTDRTESKKPTDSPVQRPITSQPSHRSLSATIKPSSSPAEIPTEPDPSLYLTTESSLDTNRKRPDDSLSPLQMIIMIVTVVIAANLSCCTCSLVLYMSKTKPDKREPEPGFAQNARLKHVELQSIVPMTDDETNSVKTFDENTIPLCVSSLRTSQLGKEGIQLSDKPEPTVHCTRTDYGVNEESEIGLRMSVKSYEAEELFKVMDSTDGDGSSNVATTDEEGAQMETINIWTRTSY